MVENLERQNETDEFEKTRRRYGRKQETMDLGYMLWHKDEPVDVASESFVNAYVDRFNPETVEWSSYGAPKVSELGRLLAKLYKENKVGRYRHYCENWQDGYPKWFYVYYSL